MRCPVCGAEGGACVNPLTMEHEALPKGDMMVVSMPIGGSAMDPGNRLYCSDDGVYLNSARAVVFGKDPDRQTQLVAPGSCISLYRAQQYGICDAEGNEVGRLVKAEAEPEAKPEGAKAVAAPPQNKARAQAPATKQRRRK